MVEYTLKLDLVFGSLADTTRRDILRRVAKKELPIGVLAKKYQMSFAAIAKHVSILEKAHLVRKRRDGKQQWVQIEPRTLQFTKRHLKEYEKLWNNRFAALDNVLKNNS